MSSSSPRARPARLEPRLLWCWWSSSRGKRFTFPLPSASGQETGVGQLFQLGFSCTSVLQRDIKAKPPAHYLSMFWHFSRSEGHSVCSLGKGVRSERVCVCSEWVVGCWNGVCCGIAVFWGFFLFFWSENARHVFEALVSISGPFHPFSHFPESAHCK